MSRNCWETGTITLPSKDAAPLRKALRETHNALRAEALTLAKELHKPLATKNLRDYRIALHNLHPDYRRHDVSRSYTTRSLALALLASNLHNAEHEDRTRVLAPTSAMMDSHLIQATNRTTQFPIIGADGYWTGDLTFTDRTLVWDVDYNNHAVENAHEGPTGKVLFPYLDRITWTRGTGGYATGNDEYHQDDDSLGGGGNYLTFHYGPLGHAARASEMGISLAEYRKRGFDKPLPRTPAYRARPIIWR